MKKVLLLAFKDIRLAFRDKAAILLMLAAPFLLTLGLGLVSGRLTAPVSGTSGPSDIPVLIINQDKGFLGNALMNVFQSVELETLFDPRIVEDVNSARVLVNDNQVAGLVIIPAGFTDSIISGFSESGTETPGTPIEFYANPARPTSSGIIESILRDFLSRVEEDRLVGTTTVLQLVRSGKINPLEAAQFSQLPGGGTGEDGTEISAILSLIIEGDNIGPMQTFDIMAYMAPGMALLFLMFTATYGGRSFLLELRKRTLQRLLTTPTTLTQVFAGKMLGVFLTGVLQLFILIGASSLLFNLRWGNWLGVSVLILCCTFAATGWGLFITSFARTPGQVSTVGSALMLLFGLLGGSFTNLDQMPRFFKVLSRITPNAWGLDGFSILALGGDLVDLGRPLMGLLVMGSVLFLIAVGLFSRNRRLLQ